MCSIVEGNRYIATRGGVSQVVLVHEVTPDGECDCSYGYVSSHECYLHKSQLRALTAAESHLTPFGLPQGFYQSGPPGFPSMDAATYLHKPPPSPT